MVKRHKTYVNVDEPRDIRVSPFEALAVKCLSRRQVLKGALGAGVVAFLYRQGWPTMECISSLCRKARH